MSIQTEVEDYAATQTGSYTVQSVLDYVQLTIPAATEQQVRDVCNAILRDLGGDYFCTDRQLPDPPVLSAFTEVTSQTTTAAALEDIPGCVAEIVLNKPGRIVGTLVVGCQTSGSPADAGYAVSINGVDGTAITRTISSVSDSGAVTAKASADLPAGTYQVKGRHYRVSGAGTISTDVAQLEATGFIL